MLNKKGFHIPADPKRVERDKRKRNHGERKKSGRPATITNAVVYDLLVDIIDELQDLREGKGNGSA